MFYPITQTSINWLPTFSNLWRKWFPTPAPTTVQQLCLQPADQYHLDAGVYRLRVLAGSVWVPEMGIFAAGQQLVLTPDASGLAIHAYSQHPAVFTLRSR